MPDMQPKIDELIEKVRTSLDDLIREIQAVFPADPLQQLAAAVEVSATVGQVGDHLVSHFIDVARGAGESWAAIGDRLGISRQAVQKRYAGPAGPGGRKLPAVFEQMVNPGRRAIVASQGEALRRQTGYIGTEHLLLGIVTDPECVGARALAACGSSAETVTAAINGRIGIPPAVLPAGATVGSGHVPFSGKGKSVLEHAQRESVRLGQDFIGTGHLALGCLTVQDGLAAEILGNLGVGYEDLRREVTELGLAEQP
jgi:Clp amino terminal domain, pathogenicity island component